MKRREFLITSAALAGSALPDKALGGAARRPQASGERAIPGGRGRFPPNNKIVELMQVPAGLHDLNWLKQSLQAAIGVQLSALPPYLCAMWSIVTQRGPAYDLIHSLAIADNI